MSRPLVIALCNRTENMLRPWADAGCECIAVDTAHSIRRDHERDGISYVWGDCRSWTPPRRPSILFGFSPCTHLAVSGARDFGKKAWPMLRDGMDMFWSCLMAARWAGCPFMLENPVGRISGIHATPDHTFDPCDYAGYLDDPLVEAYTKRTCLWTGGGFVMPEPKPVEAVDGSRMHLLPPSDNRADLRSVTPMGFAGAVFEANKAKVLEMAKEARDG